MAGVIAAASRLRNRSSVGAAARLFSLVDTSSALTGDHRQSACQQLLLAAQRASSSATDCSASSAPNERWAGPAGPSGRPPLTASQQDGGRAVAPIAAASAAAAASGLRRRFSTAAASVQLQEHAPEAMLYRIDVVTGDIRGAGTSSPAKLQLVGSAGVSDAFLLGEDDVSAGFERGTKRTYLISVDRHIGDLQRVHVEQMAGSVTELGTGWFLDRVDVTRPGGEVLSFPCGTWIGKADDGGAAGPMARNLIPCSLAGRPKGHEARGAPISIAASAFSVPHPDKVAAGVRAVNHKAAGFGGEDAYFMTKGSHGVTALGVADGVYMWRSLGIDSGAFSRQLMADASRLVEGGCTDVLALMQKCEKSITASGTQGSSTVCIVLIDEAQGRLTSANLGDSGFLVLGTTHQERHLHVKYRSPQQEHEFGWPFQLGTQDGADSAEDSILMTLRVVPGDLVVLGSDGLFDNVPEQEVVAIAEQLLREGACTPAEVARCLLHAAYHNSIDRQKATPYSQAATEVFDMVYSGGKKDDITVMVCACGESQLDGGGGATNGCGAGKANGTARMRPSRGSVPGRRTFSSSSSSNAGALGVMPSPALQHCPPPYL